MKQVLKKFAKRITAAMDRLGEDFNMILFEDVLPYPSDMTSMGSFDEEDVTGNYLFGYSI